MYSCAAIQSPPGGAKDTTPPELLETIPPNGTILYKGGRIELIFSEYLNENTVEKSIRILPTLDPEPKIIYKGRRLYIEMPGILAENQTYIISIDRTLQDEHKVPLSQGIQVAFSTGETIATGKISGTVSYHKSSSVQLWKIKNDDDLKLFYQRIPDYVVDASDSGYYEFRYLSNGDYRIVGVDRSASGLQIAPERMIYGLTWEPLIILDDDKNVNDLNIRMPQKLGGIKMNQAEWKTGDWSVLTFSENINDYVSNIDIKVQDDDSSITIPEIFLDPLDQAKLNIIIPDYREQTFATFITNGLYQGNISVIDSGMIKVRVDTLTDTSNMEILSPKNKYLLSIDSDRITPLEIIFSSLIDTNKSNDFMSLLKDSLEVPFMYEWETPLSLTLRPKENWVVDSDYQLSVVSSKLVPVYGKVLLDSIKTISFKTSDFLGYGQLLGDFINLPNVNHMVELYSLEKEPSIFRTVVNSDGTFKMKRLPEGNYKLFLFQDDNKNNRYSFGEIDPYSTAEKFFLLSDTLKIRSNWDLELNQINMELNP